MVKSRLRRGLLGATGGLLKNIPRSYCKCHGLRPASVSIRLPQSPDNAIMHCNAIINLWTPSYT